MLFCSYRLRKCSFKERKWYGFDALNLKTAIILFSNFNLRVTFSILHYQRYHFYFRNFSKNTPARLLYNKAKKQKLYSVFNTMRIHLFTISNQSRRSLLQRLLQLITGQVTFKVFMATKKMIDVNNKASLPFFLGRKNNGA